MLRILAPGAQTTVQDLGRPGLGDQGISPGGAMDTWAYRVGNLIVGNAVDAAALEVTLAGPTLQFEQAAVVAVCGAPFRVTRRRGARSTAVPPWQAVAVDAGDVLEIGAAAAGARAYVCVAGGIDLAPVLGSRSTHLLAELGGVEGRALRAGDMLPLGRPARPTATLVGRRLRAGQRPTYANPAVLRVVLGPQADRFTPEAVAMFLSAAYTVLPDSNRMGVRLTGPALTHTRGADLLSEGIGLGAIQVPNSGQPIILMAERQTTGGYTKIATVIGADIERVAQARPGAAVCFRTVTLEEAVAERREREASVDEASIERVEGWGAEDVAQVIAAFAASGLAELKLQTGGIRLALRRDLVAPAGHAATLSSAGDEVPETEAGPDEAAVEVTAPVLGIFYAAPAPEEPPFVALGDDVTAGQVVGLIDVMKTLHQIRAPRAGRVTALLAANGSLVEYGQTVMRLATTP